MNTVVGDIRPSQLLWSYGPGSLIDLPNLSVTLMGLDRWDKGRCTRIDEARLLEAVRQVLGTQVGELIKPPVIENERVDPLSAEARIGVPVRPFPRWLRCVRCGLLGDVDSRQFELKDNPFRPDRTHYIHLNCVHGRRSDAVPARFLLACRNGHLDDFPWHWFVHGGPSSCQGTLRFFEGGASLQTENLWVKCDQCGDARSLVHAFGEEAQKNLPKCRGRHPHLDSHEECTETARTVLLGASNSWFPIHLSVLAIPTQGDLLSQIILDAGEAFAIVEAKEELPLVIRQFKRDGAHPGIENYSLDEIWDAIKKKRSGGDGEAEITEKDVKRPEWAVLTSPSPPSDWPYFLSERIDPPPSFNTYIQDVLLLKRLREVNALIGFTRVEAPEESLDPEERPPMAPLTQGVPEWVPANEVHGEGIFLRFNEQMIHNWEQEVGPKARDQRLLGGHAGWRTARNLDPMKGYLSIRYAMLHTLSHLLIREFALECGYNAASIRERIYADPEGEKPMAGVLLYTAAADSDGTLGGLVELGKPENLGIIISQALERARICSSDPICSEHDPAKDRSLHSASCHACGFVSETSCERGNRYLDRALLVKTFDCSNAAFFK